MAATMPEQLLEQIAKHWGWEVGDKVRQEIQKIVGAANVDIEELQNAISVIQGLLDADPNTPEFDVGQNIIRQLSDHLARITNLEEKVARLNGDENTVGSVAYAVKQERDRATAAEANLQSQITSNTEVINTLNGDENTEGSVKKQIADAKTEVKEYADNVAQTAASQAEANAKAYVDEHCVTKEALANISAETLASIFRHALDCGFAGKPKDDVLNGTGDCAAAASNSNTSSNVGGSGTSNSNTDNGDGAVL